jgi:NADH-quinone oxidoreductase subunit K
MIPLSHYLSLGAIIFIIGSVGVLTRKNAIIILMSIELMLNGVNITLVGFSYHLGDLNGQIFALFVIAVAAGEAAVGLAIIVALFRCRAVINVDEIRLLKW